MEGNDKIRGRNQFPDYLHDLERCGIATSNNLHELLTTCQDPVEAIKQFQHENSIKLDSLKPALKLFDLHGVLRSDYDEMVVNELTERLLLKIRQIGQTRGPDSTFQLEQQLEKCFNLHRVPRLKPIVLEVLNQLPRVQDRYLKLVICDKEFYNDCSVKVKQQIWLKNDSLFIEAVEPAIDFYIIAKQKQILSMENSDTNFFTSETVKIRRNLAPLQHIVQLIFGQDSLYLRLIQIIRNKFLVSGSPYLCSLRFEILMAIHDLNFETAMNADPCHEFAWCLDACLRSKNIEMKQIMKLKNLLDKKKDVDNEIAMVAGDPHILHFFSSRIIKQLKDNALTALPRDLPTLQLFVKILKIGVNAKEILNQEITMHQLVLPDFYTSFLPRLSLLMVQDLTSLELEKLEISDNQIEEFIEFRADEAFARYFFEDSATGLLFIHHFVNNILPTRRKIYNDTILLKYCQLFSYLTQSIAWTDPWLHLLVTKLITSSIADASMMGNEQIANSIYESLIVQHSSDTRNCNNYLHLLKLCIHLNKIIPTPVLHTAFQKLADYRSTLETNPGGYLEVVFRYEYDRWRAMSITTAPASVPA